MYLRPISSNTFLVQLFHLPQDHHRGDGGGGQVRQRPGQPHPVDPQQRRQDQHHGDQHDHLAQHIEEHGDLGLADGLEEIGPHHLEAHHREHEQQYPYATDPYLGQPGIAGVEQRDDGLGEYLHRQPAADGDGRAGHQGQLEGALDPSEIFGPVVEADDGLGGHVDGDHAEHHHHGHAVDDSHGAHRQVPAVFYQLDVEQRVDDAAGQLHGEGRHPDGEDAQHYFLFQPQVGGLKPQSAFVPGEVQQHPAAGDGHGDHRGHRRPGHPHVEDEDEQRVQQGIGHRPDQHGVHGDLGVALGPDHVVHAEAQPLEYISPQDDGDVLLGVAQSVRPGPEHREDSVPEDQPQHRDAQGDDDQQSEGVAQDLLGLRFVLLAQPD